jgi:predicted acetyltransferase
MSNIYLREVQISDGMNEKIYEMLQCIDKEENGFMNGACGISKEDFPGYIEKLINQKIKPEIGLVPQTTFWLFDRYDIIGFSKMRHYLNEKLRVKGGHIGYGIRKDKRNKGYGKRILELTLKEIEKIGVFEVLCTCDSDNIASRKIIEASNGKLEREDNNHCIYWINMRR